MRLAAACRSSGSTGIGEIPVKLPVTRDSGSPETRCTATESWPSVSLDANPLELPNIGPKLPLEAPWRSTLVTESALMRTVAGWHWEAEL
jgi:hypothetical protein